MRYIDTDIAYEMFLHGILIKDVFKTELQNIKTDMCEKEKNNESSL